MRLFLSLNSSIFLPSMTQIENRMTTTATRSDKILLFVRKTLRTISVIFCWIKLMIIDLAFRSSYTLFSTRLIRVLVLSYQFEIELWCLVAENWLKRLKKTEDIESGWLKKRSEETSAIFSLE